MDILLDARQLETREDAHPYLKKMLSFPEYYGGTLDSLHDCLTEMGQTRIRFLSLPCPFPCRPTDRRKGKSRGYPSTR